MIRRPPRSTRTDTLFPYTTLFRSHADQPSKQTMNIFPEENELEIRHRHIAVDCLILGRLLVEIELMLPISLVERRNDARDRVQTRNRKRAEERRVGTECVSTCRSRWSLYT